MKKMSSVQFSLISHYMRSYIQKRSLQYKINTDLLKIIQIEVMTKLIDKSTCDKQELLRQYETTLESRHPPSVIKRRKIVTRNG